MNDDPIRADIAEIFHNASLVRLQQLVRHMGIKPLVDGYIQANFGRKTMTELTSGEVKALLDMVSVFAKMIRRDRDNPGIGPAQPRSFEGISRRALLADPIMAQTVAWHRKTGGVVKKGDETFEALSPYFQLHDLGPPGYRYLHCGSKSSTAYLYGADFAARAKGRDGVPDREYDEAVREDYYRVAQCGLPMAQAVRSSLDVWGTRYFVSYCRYIFMTTMPDGQAAVNVCARFTEPPRRMDGGHTGQDTDRRA